MNLHIDVELNYSMAAPTTLLLQIDVADYAGQTIGDNRLELGSDADSTSVVTETAVGTRRWIEAQDTFSAHYTCDVLLTRANPDLPSLSAVPLANLPGAVVPYLLPSRYINPLDMMDHVSNTFRDLKGGKVIAAMARWIETTFSYVPGASDATTTATDTLDARKGVCRDYAHVLVAMARAASIPARMVSTYAPHVTPQDFHAVCEVYLDHAWHLVDPTGMATAGQMAVVGAGRDAADVSFLTAFGSVTMERQIVQVSSR